jgi:hypothetical protein
MSGQKPHTIGPFFDGGPMWFSELIRMLAQLRPGGAIRGKWRIPDGKVDVWSIFMFRAPKVLAPVGVD